MPPLNQGSFTIDATAKVTIGEGYSAENQIVITIKNTGANQPRVKVTVNVKCGATPDALLDANTAKVTATYDTTSNLSASSTVDSRSWQTSSRGVALDNGKQLSIKLSGFDSKTPPGDALIEVLVQIYKQDGGWFPAPDTIPEANRVLRVTKVAKQKTESKIHYFTVNPDFILHVGQTPVAGGFYATGFDRLSLFRNNQEVQNWPSNEQPRNADGSITGTFADHPSITTVYRLEGKPNAENVSNPNIEKICYQTVQVISPGWNQIALPQGYPARLFVNTDFSGSGMERLYGIFIDGDLSAALYSSATGVDDWRPEPDKIPSGMETSPGLAYDNKLWLIGGSCVDPDSPGSKVWCYEKIDSQTTERRWNPKAGFPSNMQPRAGHACAVVPRKKPDGTIVEEVWVLGGYNNGKAFGDVWKLEDGKNWIQIRASGTMWSPRYMHAAISFTPARGQQAEVWIYGGNGEDGAQTDLWSTKDVGLTWNQSDGIVPPPGEPLGAALVSFDATQPTANQRLFLSGTFLEPAASGKRNRTSSSIFEWQWRNQIWEARPVVDGWERFAGSTFYMQAIAFNSFLFVWSLHTAIAAPSVPKLNILIS